VFKKELIPTLHQLPPNRRGSTSHFFEASITLIPIPDKTSHDEVYRPIPHELSSTEHHHTAASDTKGVTHHDRDLSQEHKFCSTFKNQLVQAKHPWPTPIIPVTRQAETRRIKV
jgi:hypothetical protein